jgi:hypothetical protein
LSAMLAASKSMLKKFSSRKLLTTQ